MGYLSIRVRRADQRFSSATRRSCAVTLGYPNFTGSRVFSSVLVTSLAPSNAGGRMPFTGIRICSEGALTPANLSSAARSGEDRVGSCPSLAASEYGDQRLVTCNEAAVGAVAGPYRILNTRAAKSVLPVQDPVPAT